MYEIHVAKALIYVCHVQSVVCICTILRASTAMATGWMVRGGPMAASIGPMAASIGPMAASNQSGVWTGWLVTS